VGITARDRKSSEYVAWLKSGLLCLALLPTSLIGETISIRHREGLVHGFLALSTLEGETIANGDLTQVARGDRVTNHLHFDFKDGSVHDEMTAYSERGSFKLIRYHLKQKGPSFPRTLDTTVDGMSGQATVRYSDDDGKPKVETEKIKATADLANGLVLTLLKNILPETKETKVTMVASTPKPRLVTLAITPQQEATFAVGVSRRKATLYAVKVEIGGVAGIVAPLLGKQPPDTHVWILGGDAPCFVKSEGPMYFGGPIWRIELISPSWPKETENSATAH
jgi:hypothetical protein